MVVTTTTSAEGQWQTFQGTLQEIIDAFEDQQVRSGDVVTMFHDGTNYVAIARKGRASN